MVPARSVGVRLVSDPSDANLATPFDSSSEARSYVVRSTGGKYLQISASAYQLLSLRDQGMAPPAIAARLGGATSPLTGAQIEGALTRLDAQIESVDAQPLSSGFLFERSLVPAPIVRPIARALAPLFRLPVAVTLASTAVAIIIWLFASRGVPAVTFDTAWPAFGLSLATLLVHELGHAAACARFGAAPSAIGFTIYVVYPAFYCDVSAAWRLPRRQRLVVDVGGFYLQSIAIASVAVLSIITGWAPLHLAAWMALGTCALSLNPMFKFDGYWIVADALGVANLALERSRILRHYWDRLRGRVVPTLPYPRWIRILLLPYAVITFAFFGWFMSAAAPALGRALVSYPGKVHDFVLAIRDSGAPGVREVLGFLAATFVAGLGVLFFRQVVRWVAMGVRGLRRIGATT